MLRLPLAALICGVAMGLATATPAAARTVGCDAFMESVNKAAGEYGVLFSRALSVGGGGAGFEYYDAAGAGDVTLSVACKEGRFVRLEISAPVAVAARADVRYERLRTAALQVALGMNQGRATGTLRSLDAEAKDYLRASAERGDVSVSGRTERHLAGGVTLGMMATNDDRSFVVITE